LEEPSEINNQSKNED